MLRCVGASRHVLTGSVALLCSYGKKNPEFLKMVPSGLLPVIVLDGRVITESLDIMVHHVFSGCASVSDRG
jgi:hypothetical protein